MSARLELLTPDRAPRRGGSLGWAHALREREHSMGLGTKLMTEFQREAWREVFEHELTEEERATAPRRLTGGRIQRRGG